MYAVGPDARSGKTYPSHQITRRQAPLADPTLQAWPSMRERFGDVALVRILLE